METASKTQREARGTDRVFEALSTLAALLDRTIHEVKDLDSDFQGIRFAVNGAGSESDRHSTCFSVMHEVYGYRCLRFDNPAYK